MTIKNNMPFILSSNLFCKEASAIAEPNNENNPIGVVYINQIIIFTKIFLKPLKKATMGFADSPTELQANANTIPKMTTGIISNFAAASIILGGNNASKNEEKPSCLR